MSKFYALCANNAHKFMSSVELNCSKVKSGSIHTSEKFLHRKLGILQSIDFFRSVPIFLNGSNRFEASADDTAGG